MPDDEVKYPVRPSDPLDGEPPDNEPLYYRTSSHSIVMDDGKILDDTIKDLQYVLYTHHHNVEEIDETPDDQFVAQYQIERWDYAALYTNDTPIYETHGGVLENMTFKDMNIHDVLDLILYPYLLPIVTAEISAKESQEKYHLIGTSFKVTGIKVNIKRKSDDITKIEVLNNNTVVYTYTTEVAKGGAFSFNPELSISDTCRLYVRVTDAKNGTVVVPIDEHVFVYPIYYGSIGIDAKPTEAQLKTLTGSPYSKENNCTMVVSSNNSRITIAYPNSYGDLKKIYDANGLEYLNMFDKYNLDITADDNKTVVYNVYMNNRSTVDNFDINIRW